MVVVVGWSCLLVPAISLRAEGKTGIITVSVTIPEQAQLQLQGGNVNLKIRLAPGVSARLWRDDSCRAPHSESNSYSQSGSFVIPLDSLPRSSGAQVCLLSSDGVLRSSMELPTASAP
jgi:hypothetical protein